MVSDSYIATPVPGSPLRLRIDFTPGIYRHSYDGLRLKLLHVEQGPIDQIVLGFAEHRTFRHRDATTSGTAWPGTFRRGAESGPPPWEGADLSGLRSAVVQYTDAWFPGAWEAPTPTGIASRAVQAISPPARPRTGGPAR
ncbi:hypothetical protein ACFUEM_25255 [Streptomyces anulatus]|uniref:hypothetical protein n=1 Tax=Streptomyces anulatus TaxID=1892 RepID=UPI0035DEA588